MNNFETVWNRERMISGTVGDSKNELNTKALLPPITNRRELGVSGSDFDGKASIVVVLSDQLVKSGLNASNIIKSVVSEIEGSGGGQPFFATAGGKKIGGINVAMDKVINYIR